MIKLRGTCENCKRVRFFVRKRKVKLPIGPIATSQMMMCGACYTKLIKALKTYKPMDMLNTIELEEVVKAADEAGRKVIVLFEDTDGNWRGFSKKNGVQIQTRQGDPNTALVSLITHDGKA